MRTCPFCAEVIQDAAVVCKHCGRDLAAPSAAPAAVVPTRRYGGRHLALAAGLALLLGGGGVVAARGVRPGMSEAAQADSTARPDSASEVATDTAAAVAAALGRAVLAGEITVTPPAPPAPPPPQVVALVDEGAVEVGPERWLEFGFTVADDGDACRLAGRVLGLTGGNRDVEVYVLTADDYLNWRADPRGERWRTAGVFSSPRQTATSLDVALPAPGEYHLVVSNRFSVATAKNVQLRAHVTCAREAATAAGA